jgi:hypothetical protein
MINRFCLTILFVISIKCCCAQLKIDTNVSLDGDYGESVKHFIDVNQFSYALMYWNTSNWLHTKQEVSGLIQQNHKWYIVKMIVPAVRFKNTPKYIQILSSLLNKKQIRLILKSVNPYSTFRYTQSDFDSLSNSGCRYSIFDAGTVHLAEYKKEIFNNLYFDSPQYYVDKCATQFIQYKILEPFIKTSKQMDALVKEHIK